MTKKIKLLKLTSKTNCDVTILFFVVAFEKKLFKIKKKVRIAWSL